MISKDVRTLFTYTCQSRLFAVCFSREVCAVERRSEKLGRGGLGPDEIGLVSPQSFLAHTPIVAHAQRID